MDRIGSARVQQFAGRLAGGSACIALITALCFSAHLNLVIPSLIYLLVVVVQSLWAGFASSAVVSVIAVCCLEYFFIPPVLEWQINNPEDAVALCTYGMISLLITRLASRARGEARVAERKRHACSLLYRAASTLLSPGPQPTGAECLSVFRDLFGLRSVCLFDATSSELHANGESAHQLDEKTRDSYLLDQDYEDRDNHILVRRFFIKGSLAGAIGFDGAFDDDSIALALPVLAATAIDRIRTNRKSSEIAAQAHAEMLRSAILDAFAHEFKTPLAIILAAAGALRESDAMGVPQKQLAEFIENQIVRLNGLTSRLLRTATLETEEVNVTTQPSSLSGILRSLIDQDVIQDRRQVSLRIDGESSIMADPELLGLAVNQILDNAAKYSFPGTTIAISVETDERWANLSVTNHGHPVEPGDHEHIFERFGRGVRTADTHAGNGLGLYVARKIVRAHGGVLELDLSRSRGSRTTFLMRLPIARIA